MSKELFADLIESKITQIEKESAAEFVPVWLKQAGNYRVYRIFMSLLFTAVASLLYKLFAPEMWLPWWAHGAQVLLSFAIFLALSHWPPFLRGLLRFTTIDDHAMEHAIDHYFLREEVFATEKRTGIMILVCELERRVFICADKGLKGHVEERYWAELGAHLAHGFGTQSNLELFSTALDNLNAKLKQVLPPSVQKRDELSNKLRIYPA